MNSKLSKRTKLLDQGVYLLMNQGYHATGINEIVNAVQVPKGSFYSYFDSKEEFAAQAITHYMEPFIQLLTRHLQHSQVDPLSALKNYYAELIVAVEKNGYKGGCLLGNLMGEIGDTSERCNQALKSAIERYKALQYKALLQAQKEGTVRTDRSAEIMANLLVNNWQGALLRMKIEQSVQPLQEFCDTLLNDYFVAKSNLD
ncbi:TetR family transcriptional regulator [Methylotuvimicrobium buryatense]|uniref:TetR family transcriptional regulator n=2 Tax=Methylotuvimicrobium buryatense TaxID=95641 RepID=A0A4P9UTA8_METBY|nr:TetR/AcrR family transcriptional regulator [Methylotuvimicrobium buryatense]QCW84799.1 TetR family transcriptional regulator [Methylotuvimicrobium buryatense]